MITCSTFLVIVGMLREELPKLYLMLQVISRRGQNGVMVLTNYCAEPVWYTFTVSLYFGLRKNKFCLE